MNTNKVPLAVNLVRCKALPRLAHACAAFHILRMRVTVYSAGDRDR